jgi:hypothetical protein
MAPVAFENVHKLSLFELRQELTRRGRWDIPDDEISYKNVLGRMIAVLHEEKEKEEADRASQQVANEQTESLQER